MTDEIRERAEAKNSSVPHQLIEETDCCGVLYVRDDDADIACNECGQLFDISPAQTALTQPRGIASKAARALRNQLAKTLLIGHDAATHLEYTATDLIASALREQAEELAKRYKDEGPEGNPMVPFATGEWVKYEDVKTQLSRLRDENERLRGVVEADAEGKLSNVFCGMQITYDASLPEHIMEWRHKDGRVDRFNLFDLSELTSKKAALDAANNDAEG